MTKESTSRAYSTPSASSIHGRLRVSGRHSLSARAIFEAPSRNSSITTIASGITKDSRIGVSMGARPGDVTAGSVGVRGSVAYQITMSEPREVFGRRLQPLGGDLGQYGRPLRGAALVAVVQVVRLAVLFAEHEDAVGIRVRVWLQKHTVHDAEDRRIQSDAESDTEDCHRGKPLAFPQAASSVTDILHQHRSFRRVLLLVCVT
jgi:hypothetical protein